MEDFYDVLADAQMLGPAGMRAKWTTVPGVRYPAPGEREAVRSEPRRVEREEEGMVYDEVPEGYAPAWDAMCVLECSISRLKRGVDEGDVRRVQVMVGRSKIWHYSMEDVARVKKLIDEGRVPQWKRG